MGPECHGTDVGREVNLRETKPAAVYGRGWSQERPEMGKQRAADSTDR